MLIATLLAVCGLSLATIAAWADVTFHRGVGDGATAPIVRHFTGRDLATNVDLTRFSTDQLPAVTAGLQANGFRYVRQSFSWAEIEPAPGEYVWDRYDAIVAALSQRSIVPIAVIHRSPQWIRSPGAAEAFDAPPADLAAFERFVTALAARYGDTVPFLQIWDLPNRSDRWGGNPADAASYVSLLAMGSNAARAANPNAVIVLAEFDPGWESGGTGDVQFLKRVYAAGGGSFFDVVAARADGGLRTPYDRAVSASEPSLSRTVLIRDVVEAAGDGGTPIWATHFGWQSQQLSPSKIDDATQAAYAVAGLERTRAEWPWMGLVFQWGLVPGPDLGGGTPAGLALLREDGSPSPLLTELGAFFARGGTGAAPTGHAPVAAGQYVWEGNWESQHLGADTFRTTSQVAARFRLRFQGTGIIARARLGQDAGAVEVSIDGEPIGVSLESFQTTDVDIPLARRLPDGSHEVAMALVEPGQLTIGGLVVERTIPLQWPILLLLGGGALILFFGLLDLGLFLAERGGMLDRGRGGELWPELPQIPDWRPARRA